VAGAELGELERLRLFVELAEELGSRKYVLSGGSYKLSMTFNQSTGLVNSFEQPDDEDTFRSFLLSLRRFISDGEPVFLSTIHNLLLRRLPEGEHHDLTKRSREIHRTVLKTGKMQLAVLSKEEAAEFDKNPAAVLKGTPVTPEYIVKLWINAVYFHNDQQKRKELEELKRWAGGLPEFTFIDTVNVITNQIGITRGIIKEVLVLHPTLFE